VLALPLTGHTRGILGAAALQAMRASTYLINVGRGELVDDEALVAALRAGGIAGAGLDVFAEEPLAPTSPYWELDNVILTPSTSSSGTSCGERRQSKGLPRLNCLPITA
jgi:D-2-hydroxyacid dehydrogenase (NADP+)